MAGKEVKVGKAAARSRTWGYIEGYYGRLLAWDQRRDLIDRIGSLGGDAYLYAPKEDPLHRRDWRAPYPAPWRKAFGELAARARRRGVDLVPGMAPGLSFDYLSAADYRALLRKLASFRDLGCRTLALLMDDIPPSLPKRSAGVFRSLGEAHGRLLRLLAEDLGSGVRLWFCPTVYTDQFAAGPVASDPYLVDLAATLPKGVTVLWTGPRIISPRLGRAEIGALSRMFRGEVILWDNLYAHDYCPNRIFLGPYRGRPADTWEASRGVLLNPTGLPATDAFLIDLLAANARGEPADKAWKAALEARAVPRGFLAVSRFLSDPFFRPGPADLAPSRARTYREALKRLLWDWKGELHQEWYPFLFMLDADLRASGLGKEPPDEEWVRKRYPPLVARLLLGGAGKGPRIKRGKPITAPEFL